MKFNNAKLGILLTVFVLVLPQSLVFANGANDNPDVENEAEIYVEESENEEQEVEMEVNELENDGSQDKDKDLSEQEQEKDLNQNTDIEEQTEKELEKETNEEDKRMVPEKKSTPKYTIGDRGKHVVELKEKLTNLGFGNFPEKPSEAYGPVTSRVVKDFQRTYGLSSSGNADQTTLNKIDEILNSKYSPGQRGEHVRELKKDLTWLGFGNFPSNPSVAYGSVTAGVVKEFQQHYNLPVSGIAESQTLNKIEQILNPPYTNGHRGLHIVQLKKDLTTLGFGNFPSNPSLAYGSVTSGVVQEFQKAFSLKATGDADQKTLDKLDEILNSEYSPGQRGEHVRELKKNLTQLGFGNFPSKPSTGYGSVTAGVVEEFQQHYNLPVTGIAEEQTLSKIEQLLNPPYTNGHRGLHIVQLKKDLTTLGFGNFPSNPSLAYGSVTSGVVQEFQKAFSLKATGDADQKTLDKLDEILNSKYSPGQRGEHVRELKKNLTQLGFGNFPSKPSTGYGSVTAGVVEEFQQHYNLPVTGIAEEQTLSKIEQLLNPPYTNGHRGLHIVQLKKDLTTLGFGNFPSNPSLAYGSVTADVVKEFQQFYSLKVDGIVDEKTLQLIESIIENPYKEGLKAKHVVQLKKNLTSIGFGNFPSNPSESYGKVTTRVVKEFQEYYRLSNISGTATGETIQKIQKVMNSPYQKGKKGSHIIELKKDLKELGFGNFPSSPSENYGAVTESVVLEFQKAYQLIENGIADSATLSKIAQLKKGLNYVKYDYSLEEAVEIQMSQMPQTDKFEYAWVSKNYIDRDGKVTASKLNVRPDPNSSRDPLGTLSKGTKVDIIDEKGNWYAIKYNNSSWVHAVREDLRYYLDPDNFVHDQRQRFQFLDLSKRSGASRSVLNNYLKGKGVLQGQGKAFIDAARAHGVNDIYLISHSILETGHGTSNLASGVRVGKNAAGEPTLVKGGNEKSLTNIKTVYNVYGVGAYDDCPLDCGAVRAYNEGWTTVAKAIKGGAEFIGGDYIKAGQNTIYKMRWNPRMNDGMAWKQYATDIGWASKQVHTMYNLYQEIGFDVPLLDIPEYK